MPSPSCERAATPDEAQCTFKAAFYGKPASTLMKRVTALNLYSRWASTMGVDTWPVSEAVAFRYVQFLLRHAQALDSVGTIGGRRNWWSRVRHDHSG